jgi:GNAT superfamily N-acetyltransferase
MNFKIVHVDNKKLFNKFIDFPYELYKENPYWVPVPKISVKELLDKKKNPFYQHADAELFLAIDENEKVLGRIAAIRNDLHNKHHKDKVGFFGFFEAIDNQDVANALFDTAKNWLKERGFKVMRGPVNPSTNDEIGFLLEGFDDSPRIMMTYTFPYYLKLSENYGMVKAKDLYAYKLDAFVKDDLQRVYRLVESIKKKYNITIRNIDLKNFAKELEDFKYVYNKAWEKNWGFVPLTDEEINYMAKNLKPLIDPEWVVFIESNGQLAGAALTLPDYNYWFKKANGSLLKFLYYLIFKKKVLAKESNWTRVVTLGLIPEFRGKGFDAVIYAYYIDKALQVGNRYGEASWLLEDNEMINRGMELLKGELYKKYRLYEIQI